MGYPRQAYWPGLPFPPPGDLPNTGMEPLSPALAGGFLTTEPSGNEWLAKNKIGECFSLIYIYIYIYIYV